MHFYKLQIIGHKLNPGQAISISPDEMIKAARGFIGDPTDDPRPSDIAEIISIVENECGVRFIEKETGGWTMKKPVNTGGVWVDAKLIGGSHHGETIRVVNCNSIQLRQLGRQKSSEDNLDKAFDGTTEDKIEIYSREPNTNLYRLVRE